MVSDGLKQENFWAGTVRADTLSGTSAAVTSLSGTTVTLGGNLVLGAGSPWSVGTVIPMTARGIVSGGMWVVGSGNGLVLAAAASTKAPLGVALNTAASGASVNVLIHGIVPMIADGTIALGGGCMVGAGAALNTVSPHVAGSGVQFRALSTAGSEGTVFVLL
jgi:hypothetical protein